MNAIRFRFTAILYIFFLILASAFVQVQAAIQQVSAWGFTERVSVASDGTQADNFSELPALSDDPRVVVFASKASNLGCWSSSGLENIYAHDRVTGVTECISLAYDGYSENGDSNRPVISSDYRYVAFDSTASNLVVGDNNGVSDVFVHDRLTGLTTIVSVDSNGNQGNGPSLHPAISYNGRYVAFGSYASNLVLSDTNGARDIFIHDRQTGKAERVSVTQDGTQGNGDS